MQTSRRIALVVLGILFLLTWSTYYWGRKIPLCTEAKSNDLLAAPRYNIENTEPKRKAVIIFSHVRTGSSFFGEYFNRNSAIYYIYDPLHEYRWRGDGGAPTRKKMLWDILHCDYSRIWDIYTKSEDKLWRKCRSGICFPEKLQFPWRNTRLCSKGQMGSSCKDRLDPKAIEKVCRQSSMTAIKIIAMNRLSELEPMLADPKLDLKVIHLVRDPRPVLASWLKADAYGRDIDIFAADRVSKYSKNLCGHYLFNDAYAKKCILGEVLPNREKDLPLSCNETIRKLWKGRFIRISHEYVSEDPIRTLDTVYNFAGLNYDANVEKWLKENTAYVYKPEAGGKDPTKWAFGTTRDSKAVISAWRTRETFEHVQMMQNPCLELMNKFGYVPVNNEQEQKNMSYSVYDLKKVLILP